jgi:hypothetical protein
LSHPGASHCHWNSLDNSGLKMDDRERRKRGRPLELNEDCIHLMKKNNIS